MLNSLPCSGLVWTGSPFPKAEVCNNQNTTIGHQTLPALLIISPQFTRSALTSLMGVPIASLKFINFFIRSFMLKVQILLSFFNIEAKAKPSPTIDPAGWSWEYSPLTWQSKAFPAFHHTPLFIFFQVGLQWYSVTLIDYVSSSLDLSLWGDKFVLLAYTAPAAEEDTGASHLLGWIPSQGESLFCSGNLPRLFSVY